MLLATIQVLLDTYSPTMYLLHDIHRHVSQPSHIDENIADIFDWLFNSFIDVYSWVALHLHPFKVGCIFRCFAEVLFGKKCQKFSRFSYIPPYFIYTLPTSLNWIVHYMKETSALQTRFVFLLQCLFNFVYRVTFERAQKCREVEWRVVL